MKIVGMSGSLRASSINSGLLRAAADMTPAGHQIVIGSIRDIPLYNGDSEARDGIPPAVQELKELIAAADGLLIATPEYNNSLPGVLKNAIDWLSRPAADVCQHCVVAVRHVWQRDVTVAQSSADDAGNEPRVRCWRESD